MLNIIPVKSIFVCVFLFFSPFAIADYDGIFFVDNNGQLFQLVHTDGGYRIGPADPNVRQNIENGNQSFGPRGNTRVNDQNAVELDLGEMGWVAQSHIRLERNAPIHQALLDNNDVYYVSTPALNEFFSMESVFVATNEFRIEFDTNILPNRFRKMILSPDGNGVVILGEDHRVSSFHLRRTEQANIQPGGQLPHQFRPTIEDIALGPLSSERLEVVCLFSGGTHFGILNVSNMQVAGMQFPENFATGEKVHLISTLDPKAGSNVEEAIYFNSGGTDGCMREVL